MSALQPEPAEARRPAWPGRRLGSWLQQSLARRLTVVYLLTTLSVVLILSGAVYLFATLYLDARMTSELAAQADFYAVYASQLAANESTLAGLAPTVVTLFAPQVDLNVRFFAASDGRLLAATQDIGPQPSQAALVELRYRSPTLFVQASRDLPGRRYAAQQIVAGGQTIGVVEVSRSLYADQRLLASLRYILLGAVLVGALLSLWVSVVLARRLSRPILDMEKATRRIAAGELDVRLAAYSPDELGRLAESIQHMAGRLKELEAARARFIGEISHDLRTPLTAIKGLLVNLIDDGREAGTVDADGRASLEVAEQETDRLIRLVNQLLDWTRWQSGRLTIDRRPVDLTEIARRAVVLNEPRARHRNIALHSEIPQELPPVSGDADRLERVLLNLLDNAVKFTPGGGQITLQVRRGEGEIAIGVQDNGRGMSEEERSRAFEPYHHGQGGGAGLGLAITRAIVEAHGGRIAIQSELNEGTRVWFALPL